MNTLQKKVSVLLAVMCSLFILAGGAVAEGAEKMTISPTSATVQVDSTKKITVKVNGKAVSNSKCTFTSSNKKVATVSSKGVVTAKKQGTATITVKLKSNKKVVKKCKITVKPKMTLSASSATIYKGNTKKLTVKVNNKSYSAGKCTFSSSDKSVATVSSSGTITAKKAGKATITVKMASDKTVYKKCTVTVKNSPVKTDASALKFSKGGTRTMKVTYNGKNAGGGSLLYSSSNTKVATVNSDGLITAKSAGTAVITAKAKKDTAAKATCKITVIDGKNFTVTPNDLPINGYAMNFGAYNAKTRPFYMLTSYLRVLEQLGGGTLTLTKGTYNITNALYVPSNVTIKFKDGVVLNKGGSTGTSKLSASSTMFMLCAPSVIDNNKTYSGYNGVHDVKFIGSGSVTIKMNNAPSNLRERVAVVLCHCKNISFENLKFTGLNGSGHFVELDASNNVTFTNCSFSNSKLTLKDSANECINLDVNDKNTGGFTQSWTNYDCTPNTNIKISKCTFTNVQTAVGTHAFTPGKYHTNVTVDSCKFTNCVKYAVGSINWKNASITNNTFNGIGRDTTGKAYGTDTASDYVTKGIYVVGSSGLTISNNTFKYVNYPMYFNCSYTSSNYPGKYTFNNISEAEYAQYGKNNYVDMSTSNYNDVKVVNYGATAANPTSYVSPPHYYCKEL
ncbi:MAG: Ig-like domain-containing protein [Eubacterium sp.]